MKKLFYQKIKTPIGQLTLLSNDSELVALFWEGEDSSRMKKWQDLTKKKTEILALTMQQLREYFKGQRKDFDLPLCLEGTQFQNSVWRQLSQIPYGQTTSYQDIAQRINRPKAVRAVGAANGQNPIPVIIPCHRVIGKNGTLTGFGGGLPLKKSCSSSKLNFYRESFTITTPCFYQKYHNFSLVYITYHKT